MIKNYLTTALRVMLRQKAYAAINIIGLSAGIAASLIIIIYIADEIGYDRFHADYDKMYRVGFSGKLQGNEFNYATSPAPLADALMQEVPDVKEVIRLGRWRTVPVAVDEKVFTEKEVILADSNFFKFFTFKVLSGDPETFLKGTNKLVITERVAKRYFGDEDPVGKTMLFGTDKRNCMVTGVVANPPHNSHFTFDIVASSETWSYMATNVQWTSNNIYTYYKLHDKGDMQKVDQMLKAMVEKNMGAELEQYLGMSFSEFIKQGNRVGLFSQAVSDIHLHSDLGQELGANNDVQYLYVFGAIAALILLIACINFMNLSTARSANRAKEVGVRKTIGALRERLVFQFLAESTLYSIFSMMVALCIIVVALDGFNELSDKQLSADFLLKPVVVVALILFTLTVGIMAGSYPALFMTAFKPTEVLKGKLRAGFKNSALRNVLVVVQFAISIALIFGSMVVYQQIKFMQEKNLGFDKENVVGLKHTMALDSEAKAFKNELLSNPMFQNASFANNLPPDVSWNSAFRKGGSDQDHLLTLYQVDHDHLATMGFQMAEGRFFSKEYKTDTAAIVLNETAFRQMGFKNLEEAEVLSYQGEKPTPLKVIGVIKDFNFENIKDAVKPMCMLLSNEPNYEMAIRLNKGNVQEQLSALEKIWKKYAAGSPFEYSFIDQNFDLKFRAEKRIGSVILIFTILSIAIACLGLFGLAAFTAEQKAKEISIRKVMGANVSQLMVLMSRDFTILVMIAFVIASPVAWYFAEQWLGGFANRIDINFGYVVAAGVASFVIAILTISMQSLKAATENPIKAMRSE